jgi:hypothetical protein
MGRLLLGALCGLLGGYGLIAFVELTLAGGYYIILLLVGGLCG